MTEKKAGKQKRVLLERKDVKLKEEGQLHREGLSVRKGYVTDASASASPHSHRQLQYILFDILNAPCWKWWFNCSECDAETDASAGKGQEVQNK